MKGLVCGLSAPSLPAVAALVGAPDWVLNASGQSPGPASSLSESRGCDQPGQLLEAPEPGERANQESFAELSSLFLTLSLSLFFKEVKTCSTLQLFVFK